MIGELILGRAFTDSAALNVLTALLEAAAAAGFFAAPGIIYRFSVKQEPIDPGTAKRYNRIWAALFLIVLLAAVWKAKISVLTVLAAAIWYKINEAVLSAGYRGPDGQTVRENRIVSLLDKYQEIAVYLIVGVFATVVSWGVFFLLSKVLDSNNGFQLTLNTILNWCAGVLVAYPMNRSWVFKSRSEQKMKEFLGFTASRVTTLIIEEVVMLLLVDVLGVNQYVSKYAIASVIVIVLNYVFSKLFVFRKDKE